MNHPRSDFGASPSRRRHQRAGRAGPAVCAWLRPIVLRGLPALLLLGIGATAAAPEAPPASRTPQPVIERGRGAQCVAEPAFMRRNHMDLLKHQRDETVHRGVRDARASLKGCIECHASAQTGSVARAKTDFCVSCHSYAAVKLDCFECHASKPQKSTAFHPIVRDHAADTALRAQWRQLTAPGALP
jgi:hypothetical protein